MAVLAVLTALSVVNFGVASAALLGQANVAQRALLTTLARGFAAGFEQAQIELGTSSTACEPPSPTPSSCRQIAR